MLIALSLFLSAAAAFALWAMELQLMPQACLRFDASEEDGLAHRWLKHYCSSHTILLVGEGDFSFSCSLAMAFGSAVNMVPTSLDSRGILQKKYSTASVTVNTLLSLGALVLHNVDATVMAASKLLNGRLFDRIVYNFPHAGFFGSEDRKDVIRKHRLLMRKFFENAAKMLVPGGEVHVSHKDHGPYKKWKLAKQASKGCLELKESVKFDPADYPGYVNRRGDGANSGKPFPLGECRTFKFVYSAMLAAIRAFPSFSPSMLLAEGFYAEANQEELSQSGKRRFEPNLEDQECRTSIRQRTEMGWQETFFFRRSSVQVPVAPANFFGDFMSRPGAIVRRFKPYPPALPSPQSAPVIHHASRKLVLVHPPTQQQLFTLGQRNFNIQSCTPMAHQSQHIVVQQHSSMPPLPLRLL